MKKLFEIIIGALLVATGVLYVLEAFNITQFDVSLDGWWTLFIIFPALSGLFSSKDKVGNIVVLAVGVYLLLAARGIIEYKAVLQLLVGTIIVLIGVKFIVKTRMVNEIQQEKVEIKDKKSETFMAFGARETDYSEKNIKIAKVGAVFGGAKCNFSDTVFEEKSQIAVFCLFGGVDIILPENVSVKINAFCPFGGISDKRRINENVVKNAEVTINGFCMFGGADIK